MGHTIGFPTANLEYENAMSYPQDGVYVALVKIDGEEGEYRAVLNQGEHPTLPEGPKSIEIHLLDYTGILYGQMLQVKYMLFLRNERRFETLDALKHQLEEDVRSAAGAL